MKMGKNGDRKSKTTRKIDYPEIDGDDLKGALWNSILSRIHESVMNFNPVFRDKEFGNFCQIWQIWNVIVWSCTDVKGNDINQ